MSFKISDIFNINKITNYGKVILNYIFGNNHNNKQILDPLTTVIKIALLNFYDDGTKISILDNSIKIQKLNMLQGTIRWSNGSSRCKLHNLKEPIEYCLRWFPYSKYPELKNIYEYCIKGLNKLKKSYITKDGKNNIINHLFEYYIMIINNNLQEIEENIAENVIEESIILNDKLQIEIKKIWNPNDIKLINAFFKILEKRNNNEKIVNIDDKKSNKENIFNSILCFLKEKDSKIKKYLNKYSTEL